MIKCYSVEGSVYICKWNLMMQHRILIISCWQSSNSWWLRIITLFVSWYAVYCSATTVNSIHIWCPNIAIQNLWWIFNGQTFLFTIIVEQKQQKLLKKLSVWSKMYKCLKWRLSKIKQSFERYIVNSAWIGLQTNLKVLLVALTCKLQMIDLVIWWGLRW
jgi:hypothetical protein